MRVSSTEHNIALTVSDDGQGIEPAQTPREGHIGLQLVQRAIDETGGQFALSSTPGSGTTATATIPAPRRPGFAPLTLATVDRDNCRRGSS